MIKRLYKFNYSTFQYDVMDVETKEDGKKFIVNSFTMDLYFGKTNIPKVSKRK
jgi:hypothetical protein